MGNNNYDNKYSDAGELRRHVGNDLLGQTVTLTTKDMLPVPVRSTCGWGAYRLRFEVLQLYQRQNDQYTMMRRTFIIVCSLCLTAAAMAQQKTAFQTSSAWTPEIDVRSDIAIVYGANDRRGMTFGERVRSWRERGYQTHFMTGIAWGPYEDYFTGKWDGKNHFGIGQVEQDGNTIWHGRNVPYVVPESTFIRYMKEGIVESDRRRHQPYPPAEPEFWARAGYSEVFKQEWQCYWFPWQPQHTSPENTYLSSKLKYHLYYNAIKEVSEYAKSYGRQKGMDVKVYIPHTFAGELFFGGGERVCARAPPSFAKLISRFLSASTVIRCMDRHFTRADLFIAIRN